MWWGANSLSQDELKRALFSASLGLRCSIQVKQYEIKYPLPQISIIPEMPVWRKQNQSLCTYRGSTISHWVRGKEKEEWRGRGQKDSRSISWLGICERKTIARRRERAGREDWEFRVGGINATGTQTLREHKFKGNKLKKGFFNNEDQERRRNRVRC